jgi:hypothetical protein
MYVCMFVGVVVVVVVVAHRRCCCFCRGESVEVLNATLLPSSHSSLHVVLLDNLDAIFHQSRSDSSTAIALTATFLNKIDLMRTQTNFKGFIVATCTDTTNMPASLSQCARFGEPVVFGYPTMQARTSVSSTVLKALAPSALSKLLLLVESSTLNTCRLKKENIKSSSDPAVNEELLCDLLSTEISRRTQVQCFMFHMFSA